MVSLSQSEKRGEKFSLNWNRLFYCITNVRYFISKEREIDKSTNVNVESFPEISTLMLDLTELIIEDFGENGLDGECIALSVKNEVFETLTRYSIEDIPIGILEYCLEFYIDLLANLPTFFFFHEQVIRSIQKLLACEIYDTRIEVRLQKFVECLIKRMEANRQLICLLFSDADTYKNILNILRFEFVDCKKNLLPRFIELGILPNLSKEFEDLLLELIFVIIKSFADDGRDEFLRKYFYLAECVEKAENYPEIQEYLGNTFRDQFVDKIFQSTLKSSLNDNSIEKILSLLWEILCSSRTYHLIIPILSKTIRILESNGVKLKSSFNIIRLYNQILSKNVTRFCFHTKSCPNWTESVEVHRKRLGMLFNMISSFKIPLFLDEKEISEMYRRHLRSVEDLTREDHPGLMVNSNISIEANQTLRTLYGENLEKIQTVFWKSTPIDSFIRMKLILGCLTSVEHQFFYKELNCFEGEGDDSLVNKITKLIESRPSDIKFNKDVQEYYSVELDPFEDQWDMSIEYSKESPSIVASLNLCLLSHFVMRLAAILQVRATKSNIVIVYDDI